MNSNQRIALTRDCDSIEIPSGARKTLPCTTSVRIMQSRGGSYTVTTDLGGMYRIDASDADALGLSPASNADVRPFGPPTEQLVNNQLRTVFDPEIPVNIVDLGLVYCCQITALEQGGNRLDIRMTMTAPGCGMGNVLKADVERKLSRLPDVREVHVEVVFDPPWHAGLMSEAARLQLGLDFTDDGMPPTFPIIQGKS
jgi:probable FeS assembly SUF system protein SufT